MRGFDDRERLLRMPNYPGMIEPESRILREYIRRHFAQGDEYCFNLRIGDGQTSGADVSPELARIWESITKARPDTCRRRPGNRATLIEVKEVFTNEAVWQLLSYRDLYQRAFPEHVVDLVGLAAAASPTAQRLAKMQGIGLYLYSIQPGVADISPDATETAP